MSGFPNHYPFSTTELFPSVKVLHHGLRAFSGTKISRSEAIKKASSGNAKIAMLKRGVWDDNYDFTATFLPIQGVITLFAKSLPDKHPDIAFYEVEKFMELGNEQIGSTPLFFAKNGNLSRLLTSYIGTENLVAFVDTDDRPAFTSRTADFADDSGDYVYQIAEDVGLGEMNEMQIIELVKNMTGFKS